jgi:hypothetical protein
LDIPVLPSLQETPTFPHSLMMSLAQHWNYALRKEEQKTGDCEYHDEELGGLLYGILEAHSAAR